MNCERVKEHLVEYLYGELPSEVSRDVERELAECPQCAAQLEQMRRVQALMKAVPRLEVPPLVHANILREARLVADAAKRRGVFSWAGFFSSPAFASALVVCLVLVVGVLLQRQAGSPNNFDPVQGQSAAGQEMTVAEAPSVARGMSPPSDQLDDTEVMARLQESELAQEQVGRSADLFRSSEEPEIGTNAVMPAPPVSPTANEIVLGTTPNTTPTGDSTATPTLAPEPVDTIALLEAEQSGPEDGTRQGAQGQPLDTLAADRDAQNRDLGGEEGRDTRRELLEITGDGNTIVVADESDNRSETGRGANGYGSTGSGEGGGSDGLAFDSDGDDDHGRSAGEDETGETGELAANAERNNNQDEERRQRDRDDADYNDRSHDEEESEELAPENEHLAMADMPTQETQLQQVPALDPSPPMTSGFDRATVDPASPVVQGEGNADPQSEGYVGGLDSGTSRDREPAPDVDETVAGNDSEAAHEADDEGEWREREQRSDDPDIVMLTVPSPPTVPIEGGEAPPAEEPMEWTESEITSSGSGQIEVSNEEFQVTEEEGAVDVEDLYTSGLERYNDGSYREAIEYFDAFIQNAPRTNDFRGLANYYQGQAQFELGDYGNAVRNFERVVSENDESFEHYRDAQFLLAQALEYVGDYERAEAIYTELQASGDGRYEDQSNEGMLRMRARRVDMDQPMEDNFFEPNTTSEKPEVESF